MPKKDQSKFEAESGSSSGTGTLTGLGWLRRALAIFLMLVVFGIAAPVIYVMQAGGPSQIIQDQLASRLGEGTVSVRDVTFDMQFPSAFLTVIAYDVDIQTPNAAATLPEVSAVFTPIGLFNLRPFELVVSGIDLDLSAGADGWTGSPSAKLIAGLAAPIAGLDSPESAPITGLRRLRINSASVTLRQTSGSVQPLRFTDLNLTVAVDTAMSLAGSVSAMRMIDGKAAGKVTATILGDMANRDFTAEIAVDQFVVDGIAGHAPMMPDMLASAGVISGRMTAAVRGSQLNIADVDLVAVGGVINLPRPAPTLAYDSASLVMGYNRDAETLDIRQSELALVDGQVLSVTGNIKAMYGPEPNIAVRIRGNQLSLAQFYANWPDALAPDIKSRLQKQISGGELSDVTLGISANYNLAKAHLRVLNLALGSVFTGVKVDFDVSQFTAGQYMRLQGLADGRLALRMSAGGIIDHLSVAMGVSTGSLELADYPDPLAFDRVQVTGALSTDGLEIADISIDLMDGGTVSLAGKLDLTKDWALAGADFKIASNAMDIRRFYAIWPQWAVTQTRSWVDQKMRAGRVEDVRLHVVSSFADDKLSVDQIDGSITMQNVRLELGANIPPLVDLDGRMTIADNASEIILTDGTAEKLSLSAGKIRIAPITTSGVWGENKLPLGIAEVRLDGDISDGIALVRRLGIVKSGGYDLDRLQASGLSSFNITTEFPVRRKLTPADIDFEVLASVSEGDFRNLPLEIDARNADISITARPGEFGVTGTADIFGLAAEINYKSQRSDTSEDTAQNNTQDGVQGGAAVGTARLDLKASGELRKIKSAATDMGMQEFASFNLADIDMQGDADISLVVKFPTGVKLHLGDLDVTADIVVHNGRFANLPGVGLAENAELVAQLSPLGGELSGSATLFSTPIDFLLRADSLADQLTLKMNAPPSPQFAGLIAVRSGLSVGGKVGGGFVATTDLGLSNITVDLDLDLDATSISLPEISWAKLPAERGSATMRVILEDGGLRSIEDIDLHAGSLTVLGSVAMDRAILAGDNSVTFGISEAHFERLAWPGNDIGKISIELDDQGGLKIVAEASLIDLVPLRRNFGIGEGRPVSFDILADQIIVGDGISLSGEIIGEKRRGGGGNAEFAGTLYNRNKPLISESQMQLSFGPDGEFLSASGVVGGAETSVTYTAKAGDVPVMTMASTNGGGTLKGLGVTDAIRLGEMFLKTRFIDGYENFDTNIRITNFNVIDAPKAVRAYSVLGPIGLLSLLEGEGTRFDWGEAMFENRGSKIRLTQVTGQGQAVSVAFVGEYDRETRIVDVSGNLVPASLFSRIIGKIPLVGEILTGIDNAGLFVTQFSMKGDVDDPVTSVTPASIVPGLLRDLFSPAWLKREGDRILGPTDDDAGAVD